MGVVILVVAVALVMFASNAQAQPKKKDEKPKLPAGDSNTKQLPAENKTDFGKAVDEIIPWIAAGSTVIGGVKAIASSGFAATLGKGLGAIVSAPGLVAVVIIAAVYAFLRELGDLQSRTTDLLKSLQRRCYPSFGQLHALEVSFLREVITAGKLTGANETRVSDERLTDDRFREIKTIGEFVTIAKPNELTLGQWKLFNKLARNMAMHALVVQSDIACMLASRWKGFRGLGGFERTPIHKLGLSGPSVERFSEVGNGAIPYDSIMTPGDFQFPLNGDFRSTLAIEGDSILIEKARFDGLVSALTVLKNDPTWHLVYNKNEYAKEKFSWAGLAGYGATLEGHYARFPANTFGSATSFTIDLDRPNAGRIEGYTFAGTGATLGETFDAAGTIVQQTDQQKLAQAQYGEDLNYYIANYNLQTGEYIGPPRLKATNDNAQNVGKNVR